jgi:hypothetical protein
MFIIVPFLYLVTIDSFVDVRVLNGIGLWVIDGNGARPQIVAKPG